MLEAIRKLEALRYGLLLTNNPMDAMTARELGHILDTLYELQRADVRNNGT